MICQLKICEINDANGSQISIKNQPTQYSTAIIMKIDWETSIKIILKI